MEIGGYFGLEVSRGSGVFHNTSYIFNSGRSALGFILEYMKPPHVYLPFYTCNALFEPFENSGTKFSYYHLNEKLEIIDLPKLNDNELLLYINYFDVKRNYVSSLSEKYGESLVVDCTQAYFDKGNNNSWYFNSTRKFFGVPDGSDLYVPKRLNFTSQYTSLDRHEDFRIGHLVDRFNGNTKKGYPTFQENEKLNGKKISKISLLSESLLSNVDYSNAMEKRRRNFQYLEKEIGATNTFNMEPLTESFGSFYPYLPKDLIVKEFFWNNKIFLPNLWNDCLNRPDSELFPLETLFAQKLLPIPIDHRYSEENLEIIVRLINKIQNEISN